MYIIRKNFIRTAEETSQEIRPPSLDYPFYPDPIKRVPHVPNRWERIRPHFHTNRAEKALSMFF